MLDLWVRTFAVVAGVSARTLAGVGGEVVVAGAAVTARRGAAVVCHVLCKHAS